MNKSELKAIVSKYFNLVPAINTPTQNFAEATLADGTKVTNEKEGALAEGDSLFVIDAEGNSVQAPEGEHTTDSGIVVTVDAEGKITGIKEPDAEGEGSLEEMEEEVVVPAEGIQEAVIAAIAEIVMPELESMKKKMAEMQDAMKTMYSAPASVPTLEKKFSKQTIEIKPNHNQKRYEMALKNFTKN